MQAALIHNPEAGDGKHDAGELKAALTEAGFEVRYFSTADDDWADDLKPLAELLVIAGGDGTVDKVISAIANTEQSVSLGIIPLGTANNIARSMGVHQRITTADQLRSLIDSWTKAREHPCQLGVARGPWGKRTFVEAAGVGLWPFAMPEISRRSSGRSFPTAKEKLEFARAQLAELARSYASIPIELEVDGDKVSDRFIMLQCMNVRYLGPALNLAENITFGDGQLAVVGVADHQRHEFLDYLQQLAQRDPTNSLHSDIPFPQVPRLAKRVKLRHSFSQIQLDSDIEPVANDGRVTIELESRPTQIKVLGTSTSV